MAIDPLWAQAQLQPDYLAGQSGLRQAIINAIVANGGDGGIFAQPTGIDPTTGQPFQSIAQQYGIGQQDIAGAATNPYSAMRANAQTTESDRHDIVQGLAGKGLEFSGAMGAGQAHETNADAARNYATNQSLQSTLAGIGQQRVGLIQGAYQSLMNKAAVDPTIPAAPAAPAPAIPAGSAPIPQAAGNSLDRMYDQANPIQPVGASPSLLAPKIPKIKLATGYQGHA